MIVASIVDVTSTAPVVTELASVTNARISQMESFVRSVNLVSMETQLKDATIAAVTSMGTTPWGSVTMSLASATVLVIQRVWSVNTAHQDIMAHLKTEGSVTELVRGDKFWSSPRDHWDFNCL